MKLDQIQFTNPYLSLPPLCYQRIMPTPLKTPHLIHANETMAQVLEIDAGELYTERFLALLNGEFQPEGSDSFAMCYAGHQFGFFVERLGDGRAINIGSLGKWHLQLKGSGRTLYSRGGDGRAVLRSSIREYLMSEAMYGLGIPTTRALAIIGSPQQVYREDWENTAVVLRLSHSWVRFGTFEYFTHHRKFKELEALAEYVIAESYPHLADKEDRYLLMYEEIVRNTAQLMAQWQSVGFNHGVMNTDNMSIASLTIDYGPYAFLDDFDRDYICNHTDGFGRYSFGNQPRIGEWNLEALMLALSPIAPAERLKVIHSRYFGIFHERYTAIMGAKLGLNELTEGDYDLIGKLQNTLEELKVDYTLFMRTLSSYDGERSSLLRLGLYHKPMNEWLDLYDDRLLTNSIDTTERHTRMLRTNPKYVLKIYMIQEAIDAAKAGDFTVVDALFRIAQNPYEEHPEYERWAGATPEEYKNKKLSCSS